MRLVICGWFLLAVFSIGAATARAQSTRPSAEDEPARRVLELVRSGKPADLSDCEGLLGGSFLGDLLRGELTPLPRQGVHIIGAVVSGAVDFQKSVVGTDVQFEDCWFLDTVDGSDTTFKAAVGFRNCRFLDACRLVNVRVGSEAVFRDSHFYQAIDFRGLSVTGDLEIGGARFLSADDFVNWQSVRVGGSATGDGIVCRYGVNASNWEVGHSIRFDGAHFYSGETINFKDAAVGEDFILDDGTFEGNVDLGGSHVGRDLSLWNVKVNHGYPYAAEPESFEDLTPLQRASVWVRLTQLQNDEPSDPEPMATTRAVPERALDLSLARVGRILYLGGNAQVNASVSLVNSELGGNLVLDGGKFEDVDRGVDMRGLHLLGFCSMTSGCTFHGPVQMVAASVGGQLNAEGAQLLGAGRPTNKSSDRAPAGFQGALDASYLVVGQTASLSGIRADGAVVFYGATIKGDLNISKCRFTDRMNGASLTVNGSVIAGETEFRSNCVFNSCKIDGNAGFRKCAFRQGGDWIGGKIGGQVDFSYADFVPEHLSAGDGDENTDNQPPAVAALNSISVGSHIFFNGVVFAIPIDLRRSRTGGNVEFADSAIFLPHVCTLDLRGASVGGQLLFVSPNVLTALQRKIYMADLSYQGITVGSQVYSVENVLSLLRSTEYNASEYSYLESYLKRAGYPDEADDVYMQGQWRERREKLTRFRFAWFRNWFLFLLTGYGRLPAVAFLWSLIVVLIGTIVFRPAVMIARGEKPREQRYSAFWYSADLFLPVVGLHTEEYWALNPRFPYLQLYARGHKLLGWMLIPIGLAAIAGFVK